MAGRSRTAPPSLPEPGPDWIDVVDRSTSDSTRTWRFDVRFLTSAWRCIYGRGCRGVHDTQDPTRFDGCCTVGALLTDADEFRTVAAAAARLDDTVWQHRRTATRLGWFKKRADGRIATRVVQGGCIFLNRPGFATGPGCALHHAAVAAGEQPLDWKPNVCWQLPLRREDHLGTDDATTISVVRAWQARDWDTGGEPLHWWCTSAPEAFDGPTPVWVSLEAELRAMCGDGVYEDLAAALRTAAR